MATYYIYRKHAPVLKPWHLQSRADAFRTLYCGGVDGDLSMPNLKMIIRGEWPNYDKDGLFLNGSGAEIVDIGRKYVTIKLLEFKDEKLHKIELTPEYEPGFSEIMFITMSGA